MTSSASRTGAIIQPAFEALPFLEVQHHVAGVVRAEVAIDPHDVRVREFRESLRFLDEAVEPPFVIAGAILRAWRRLDAIGTSGKIAGKIFLDRDDAVERDLVGEIGHAEPAGAEDALDFVIAYEFGPARKRNEVGHNPRDACNATRWPLPSSTHGLFSRYGARMWR
jgi:hypothetical protein